MIRRLTEDDNPNFFFLSYEATTLRIRDFMVVPKHFFTSDIIEERPPLSATAQRAGWVGCNILLSRVPQA